MNGVYFRKVQCSVCGDFFAAVFKKRHTAKESETEERDAKCGGYNRKLKKVICKKLSE